MKQLLLKDVCSFTSGKAHEQFIEENGEFILVTSKFISSDGLLFRKTNKRLTPLEEGDLCMVMSDVPQGKALAKCFLVDRDNTYTLNQRIGLFRPDNRYIKKYFYYLLNRNRYFLAFDDGDSQTNLRKDDILKCPVVCPSIEEQNRVIRILDGVSECINERKNQLYKLDELVKARFVEMFGDPIINSEKLPTMPMTDVCEIIDGDRGKNYPTADEFSDEGYCLFLNAKNVTASGFNFDNCMFVSKEKDEALRKGRLSRGDVVLTTRGTLGNLAFYTDEIPFENVRINSGMVILRMKRDVIDEVYFIEQFKMQLDDIKEKIASGSAQPQLPISTMNKIQVLIPDIMRQKDFSKFIKQVDKSKSVIQKSLEETQLLFDSLMQEYFG